ncbi:MAG: FtsW/RodA/SpoVE family cell cycle protein [Clostridia bacterium]|nr:FtsW/RodA/SpoVE family cell cycle protein [Clostridia bacterium]
MKFVESFKKLDLILLICTLILSVISILTIFGAVDNFGRSKLVMQIAMTLVGLLALWALANLDYRFLIDRFFWVFLIGSAILLLITLIFGSTGENRETANTSWLTIPIIGIAVQPSEFVKLAFICTFAKHLESVGGEVNRPKKLLPLLLHAGLIVGLILISGDLGVALVYLGIVLLMLYAAGLSVWYFVGLLGTIAASAPILWTMLAPYQRERIIYGFRPELDPEGVGRQALVSRGCIADGGLFGKGLFGGGHYEDLAASHTDFIYATVCEKFGFIGGFLVVAALVVLALRLLWIAHRANDVAGKLICFGTAAVLIVQTVENLWMCLALVPVVGITLPFMSCGGSSVLASYLLLGVAHSVAAREKRFGRR